MIRIFTALWFLASIASAADYYVDHARTSNGSGTEASPWKKFSDINWTTITTALGSGDVNIYFSSRATWNADALSWTPTSNGSATGRLSLIGDEKYNETASGTAVWQAETVTWDPETGAGNLATIQNGSSFVLTNGKQYITFKGFHVDTPTWACVQIGSGGAPNTNLRDIVIENCYCDSPVQGTAHGIWAGWTESGCLNFTIRNNRVERAQKESIYIGHYDYMTPSITGVVIEGNVVVDGGLNGQGDIDIKPPCYGAIVRNNHVYKTAGHPTLDSFVGVAVYADACQIYGNWFGPTDSAGTAWGAGIFVTTAGDAEAMSPVRVEITSCLIYNNVINRAENHGIRLDAGSYDQNMHGIQIYNNTIRLSGESGSNGYGIGVEASSTAGKTTEVDIRNNIIIDNRLQAIALLNPSKTTATIDYNLYHRASGNDWYSGSDRTWSAWQGLGYDANGIQNTDPALVNETTDAEDYHLQLGSAAIGAGTSLAGTFTTDRDGTVRGATWDIGAYEYEAGPTLPALTISGTLRIAP